MSKCRPLKFISDSESNTILVENADAAQLKTISELIDLYDKQPDDSQSVRKTETIHLDYSKAKVVAETVKDVYRDLLSANDKALQGAKTDKDSGRTFIYEFSSGDDGKGDQKMPKFKGQLSIGIDELSNSLVVSAPAYLFDQVSQDDQGPGHGGCAYVDHQSRKIRARRNEPTGPRGPVRHPGRRHIQGKEFIREFKEAGIEQ